MEKWLSSFSSSPLFPADVNKTIVFVFFSSFLTWVSRVKNFYARFLHAAGIFSAGSKHGVEEKKTEKEDDLRITAKEMRLVMKTIGISCTGREDLDICAGDMRRIFDVEPSLDEMQEAFSVFDVNGDGFIDAEELQIVLCRLGFREIATVENCRRMISACENKSDGKLDFFEFVHVLEISCS
ncbi:putative calcium-binding protein CML45 [Wolffia australiana]